MARQGRSDSRAVASLMNWEVAPPSAPPLRKTGTVSQSPSKPVVDDRWTTESHRSYTYYVPVEQPYTADVMDRIKGAHMMVVPSSLAVSNGIDPAGTIPLEPGQAAMVTTGVQTDALVTGVKSDNNRAREDALAQAAARRVAEQREREKMASSRFLANSAFTRLYHKPAFHNYG